MSVILFLHLPLMKPNAHLKRLLAADVSPEQPYSELEIGMSSLKKLVKTAPQREIVRGAVRKMLAAFYSRNRLLKELSLRYLSKVRRHVEEIDTDITHMFYSTDERINNLGVRFVGLFPRFFCNNDVVFYHVYRSRSRYRRKALQALAEVSPRYMEFAGNAHGDLDLFENLKTEAPDEYFGRLALPRLVELASLYPCLVKYFKLTDQFLADEAKKTDRYCPRTLRRLRRMLDIDDGCTMWNQFLVCMKSLRRGKLRRALAILKRLSALDISSRHRIIFSVVGRRISRRLGANMDDGDRTKYALSTSLEIKMHGLARNGVYRALLRCLDAQKHPGPGRE